MFDFQYEDIKSTALHRTLPIDFIQQIDRKYRKA